MTKVIGTCISPLIDKFSLDGFKAQRDCGVTDIRVMWFLASHMPTAAPKTWRWGLLDDCMAAIKEAGLGFLLNPLGCPSFASEGQLAFGDPLKSNIWFDDPNPATRTVAHLHRFDQTPGSKFYDVDILQPARPWLTKPPHIDPEFFRTLGELLVERYHPRWISVWNEYGDRDYQALMSIDSVSGDGPEDVVKTRIFPEVVEPFFAGVRDALWPDLVGRYLTVASDADSDIILDRCLEAESLIGEGPSAPPVLYTHALGVHPYGDIREEMSYGTTAAFKAIAEKWKNRKKWDGTPRELWCSEIGGSPQELLNWYRKYSAQYSAVFFLTADVFMPGWPDHLERSTVGAQLVAEIEKDNGPAVPSQQKVGTVVKRGRAVRSEVEGEKP